MPSIIGNLQILNISGGIANFGDALNISPKTNSKTNEGSGSSNTGGIIITNNGFNATNSLDPDVLDQPNAANN
ncbi:spore germination protein [Fervidibacillus halotolerans]|uniref:Spore germination protein n=1 Tax=Fervidibacillus halotolerans TaxID=2980027 RepID=A0A9E8RYP8_9BACI|nr:spore germination protein [Fervidibacillus halotolerans]WAA13036.1 spore germination protein [Fervidibacillus halotolerans]